MSVRAVPARSIAAPQTPNQSALVPAARGGSFVYLSVCLLVCLFVGHHSFCLLHVHVLVMLHGRV